MYSIAFHFVPVFDDISSTQTYHSISLSPTRTKQVPLVKWWGHRQQAVPFERDTWRQLRWGMVFVRHRADFLWSAALAAGCEQHPHLGILACHLLSDLFYYFNIPHCWDPIFNIYFTPSNFVLYAHLRDLFFSTGVALCGRPCQKFSRALPNECDSAWGAGPALTKCLVGAIVLSEDRKWGYKQHLASWNTTVVSWD